MRKTVMDLMTQPVTSCRPSDTMNEAARLMWGRDCGCIPVVDAAAHLVGMVTDRDICMAAYTSGSALAAIPVSRAMSKIVISCRTDDEIAVVHDKMGQGRVRRIPVVDPEGRLVGIVSLSDLVREATPDARDSALGISSEAVLAALDSISAPIWDADAEVDAWEGEGGATRVWVRVEGDVSVGAPRARVVGG